MLVRTGSPPDVAATHPGSVKLVIVSICKAGAFGR
jgi:hypothetical protein